MSTDREFGFHTRSVHAGARPEPTTGARALPIYQTTSYVFENPESAAAYFNLQEYGNTYSRIMNPTIAALEERIANLEGGVGAVCFASGMAAQTAAFFTLLNPGDHVVSSAALYGGTITQLKHLFRKLSVELTFVDPDDIESWRAAVQPNTKLLFAETIGNPGSNVLDIEAVAEIAHDHGAPLMVDNTFATPFLCRPMAWGADIVVYSATKFLGGHGTSIGGAVVDSGEFDWSNGRFPVIAEPSEAYHGLAFHETFGVYGYLMKLRAETLRDLGAAMSPFNAFLFAQGIETLPLRMRQHVRNADAIAKHLSQHEKVLAVSYPRVAGQPVRRVGGKVPAWWCGRGILLRSRRGSRGRSEVDPGPDALLPPGERWRCEKPGDPPRDDHPSATGRRRTGRRRHRSRHGSSIRWHRRRGRSHLGTRSGPRGSRLRTMELSTYQNPQVDQGRDRRKAHRRRLSIVRTNCG